jgi:hypothetical protein
MSLLIRVTEFTDTEPGDHRFKNRIQQHFAQSKTKSKS